METPRRSTRSNTNLQGYTFPGDTPDRDRRRAVRIQVPPPEPESEQPNNMNNVQENAGQQGGEAQPIANPPQPAAVDNNDVWCVNPMIVDYNPGTRTGQEIFKNKTRGLPEADKFEVVAKETPALRKLLIAKSTTLGGIITRVPLKLNTDGSVLKTGNLVEQYQVFDFEMLQRQAIARYGTALTEGAPIPDGPWNARELVDPGNNAAEREIFYSRVHSEAVATYLSNILTPAGYAKIIQGVLDKISFICPTTGTRFVDGPCLLYLLWDRIDPSLAVNVENLRATIENIKLHSYENNVDDMLTDIEEKYQKILAMDATCESIIRYTINALLSGPDEDFNNFVKRIKGEVDSGMGPQANITFNQLVGASRKYYQNQVAQGLYGKVDPRTTQIMALTTKINTLQGQLNGGGGAALTTSGNGGGGGGGGRLPPGNDTPGLDMNFIEGTELYKWRIFKLPGDGPVICFGRQYWWCSKHVDPQGRWNGMYVRHKPEQHDAVVARAKARREKRQLQQTIEGGGDAGNGGASAAKKTANATQASDKLVIKDKLKEVLCSRLMVTDGDADKLCSEICGQGKD